ncbi:MAG: PilZ domain-containing protein [Proteobacteria bacterium]|nr:PilZ domain-containing protein [Pseudomonadota bacterium]MBU1685829.1 PilZ domain-containing protein [Pseudomonadota bacterium]
MSSTNPDDFQEKRRYERIQKSFVMRYRVLPGNDINFKQPLRDGSLCDIGGGGLRFLADQDVKKNDQLVIELEFSGWCVDGKEWISTGQASDHGRLTVLGRVMWVSASALDQVLIEVGVLFIGSVQRGPK